MQDTSNIESSSRIPQPNGRTQVAAASHNRNALPTASATTTTTITEAPQEPVNEVLVLTLRPRPQVTWCVSGDISMLNAPFEENILRSLVSLFSGKKELSITKA